MIELIREYPIGTFFLVIAVLATLDSMVRSISTAIASRKEK